MFFGKAIIFEDLLDEFFFCHHWLGSFLHLSAIDIVRIVIPDMDIVLDEEPDIGVTTEEPEEFSDDPLPVDFFGSEQWESIGEVKPELSSKKTMCHVSAPEILVIDTVIHEIHTEVEILLFWVYRHRKKVRDYCQEVYAR